MANYFDATQLANLAVEKIQPLVDTLILKKQPLLDRILQDNWFNPQHGRVAENKYIIPAQVGFPMNIRGTSEGDVLPGSSVSDFVRMNTSLKFMKGRSQITWERNLLGSGGESAYIVEDIANKIVNDIGRAFRHRLCSWIYGYTYNGALGSVKSASGTTITLNAHTDSSGEPGVKYLARNMKIIIDGASDFAAGSESTSNATTITGIDLSNNTITTEDDISSGVSASDIVVPGEVVSSTAYDEYGKAITGLRQHINDDTGTYQGLSRSTYPEIQGNVLDNSGSLRALTEALVLQAIDAPMEKTFDSEPAVDFIITTPALSRKWQALFTGYRRFGPNEPLTGANREVRIAGLEPLVDVYCPPGHIFFINRESFIFLTATRGQNYVEFERVGGNVLLLVGSAADYDKYEIRGRLSCQLVCTNPGANAVLKDLTEA